MPFEVKNPLLFTPATNFRWINGLWFASLTLSLAASLLAILAKQWLNEYKSRMRAPSSSPKMWAMRHSAYKGGLERWGMEAFISTLPLLLHASLFSFLIGLCLLLVPLDDYILITVIGISAALAVFYIACVSAPFFWADCPTATQMLRYLYSVWSDAVVPVARALFSAISIVYFLLVMAVCTIVGIPFAMLDFLIFFPPQLCLCGGVKFSLTQIIIDYVFDPTAAILFPRTWEKDKERAKGRFISFSNSRLASTTIRPVLRYRARASSIPAFDQARILSHDEPLREASILTWMIRSLPAEEDIRAALCATGWLSAGTHIDYFHKQKLDSPLVHADLCRAAVDTLDNIAMRVDTVDDATTASIIRACLFVAEGPFELKECTREFLSKIMDKNVHDLQLLSFAACHSDGKLTPTTTLQLVDIHRRPVELIALSRCRGVPCPRGITRIIVHATAVPFLPYSEHVVSTLEYDIMHDERCRQIRWKPRLSDDRRLRFISAVDVGLRYSDSSKLYDWERSTISNLYGAAAQEIVSDTAVALPRDLHDRLHWIGTEGFRDYAFSIADLNAVATLLLSVTPAGRGCIPPASLYNLLDHIDRRFRSVSSEALSWILAAFQLPSDTIRLVHGLQPYPSVQSTLINSHLSLLQPAVSSREPSRSPWSQLRDIVPLESNSRELGEIVCGYTVLLLVLHRRGYRGTAQALIRELLPHDWAASLISVDVDGRYHITLHARVISQAWYAAVARRLLQPSPAQPWVGCATYPDAAAFVEALRPTTDCLTCAHDDMQIKWGATPVQPDANAPETVLSVSDPAVWDPPPATTTNEARWSESMGRAARRFLRTRDSSNDTGSLGQPDVVLESGLRPATDVGLAFVG